MTEHIHSWQPLAGGWGGRYRCPECGVFGYRKSATEKTSTNDTIYPYKCLTCKEPAVAREYYKLKKGCFSARKEWRCASHRTEENDIVIGLK
jgi:hypothetical protein